MAEDDSEKDLEQAQVAFEGMLSEISRPELRKTLANMAVTIAKNSLQSEEARSPALKSVQLDFWDDGRRAAPNAVFRSALFPVMHPKQKENRAFLQEKKLGAVSGVTVLFTGKQFDQSDLDVYLE